MSSDQPFARGRLLPCLSLYYVTLGSLPPIPFNSENNSNSPCFMRSPSSQGTSNWSMSWIWINRLPLVIIIINSLHALSSLQIVQILNKIVCFYVYKIWLYETRIWYCINNLYEVKMICNTEMLFLLHVHRRLNIWINYFYGVDADRSTSGVKSPCKWWYINPMFQLFFTD